MVSGTWICVVRERILRISGCQKQKKLQVGMAEGLSSMQEVLSVVTSNARIPAWRFTPVIPAWRFIPATPAWLYKPMIPTWQYIPVIPAWWCTPVLRQ